MSASKRQIRNRFRTATFERDKWACVTCMAHYDRVRAAVDAHHITDRNLMPKGGYVASNGISLCHDCHMNAETYDLLHFDHLWSPGLLYQLVGSSYTQAVDDSLKLG